MAAVAGCTMDEGDLAMSGGVPAVSPVGIATGLMSYEVDFGALARDANLTKAEARDKLAAGFRETDFTHEPTLQAAIDSKTKRKLTAVYVAAEHDRIVLPPEGSGPLLEAMRPMLSYEKLSFVEGGHVSMMLNARKHLVPAIVESFEELAKLTHK